MCEAHTHACIPYVCVCMYIYIARHYQLTTADPLFLLLLKIMIMTSYTQSGQLTSRLTLCTVHRGSAWHAPQIYIVLVTHCEETAILTTTSGPDVHQISDLRLHSINLQYYMSCKQDHMPRSVLGICSLHGIFCKWGQPTILHLGQPEGCQQAAAVTIAC